MGNISQYKPERHIVQSWETVTGLPWDIFDSCAVLTQRELVCPKCDVLVAARKSSCRRDPGILFSEFSAHSIPHVKKGRLGTAKLHLRLSLVFICYHERETRGHQVCG